jgi:hypothetical protein
MINTTMHATCACYLGIMMLYPRLSKPNAMLDKRNF